MKVTSKLTLGNREYVFECDEKSEMESLNKAIVLADAPTICDECKNDNPNMFKFATNKTKEGNIYVKVHCEKCGADANLGQYKTGGFFWKGFEKYVRPSA